MDRRAWFLLEVVGAGDLDGLEDRIEAGIARSIDIAALGAGPSSGLAPSVDGTTMTMGVSRGAGIAYDDTGKSRPIRLDADATVNLSGAIPTTSSRWVLVALQFSRAQSGATTDGDGATVYTVQDEASTVVLVLGDEGGGKPSAGLDRVPLVDVRIAPGTTALVEGMLDFRRAKPEWARTPGGVAQQLGDVAGHSFDRLRVEPWGDTNPLLVRLRGGRVNVGGVSIDIGTQALGGLVPPTTANHLQTALIYIDSTGAPAITYGDEVASPGSSVAPLHNGRIPLAEIQLRTGQTSVVEADIRDVRPVLALDTPASQEAQLTGDGATTVFALPFSYAPGTHSTLVFDNGVAIPCAGGAGGYAETDSTHITFGTAPTSGHKLVVRASVPAPTVPAQPHHATHEPSGSDPITPGAFDGLISPKAHAASHGPSSSDPLDFSVFGGLVAPGLVAMSPAEGVSTDPAKVSIRPFAAVVNGLLVKTSTAMIYSFADNPAAAGWWYFYAARSGTTVSLVVSATPPDATGRVMNGDATKTYLFPVRLTGGTNHYPRCFLRINRTTRYIGDQAHATTTNDPDNPLVGVVTGDTAAHDLDVSMWFPPSCVDGRVSVRVKSLAGFTAGDLSEIRGGSSAGPVCGRVPGGAATGSESSAELSVFIDSMQVVDAKNTSNFLETRVYALAFDE